MVINKDPLQIRDTIDMCLLGDDRARSYWVTYAGTAEFTRWMSADGERPIGTLPVALVVDEAKANRESGIPQEYLIACHPDYGWCSVGDEPCRDFEPRIDDSRLNLAC